MDGFGSWSEYLLMELRKMYQKRKKCDLRIKCNGENFWVHRLLMAACSEYVRNIDDLQTSIKLPDAISTKTLQSLINFVYTGNTTHLKEGDVNDLLNAASFLDMPILIECIKKENPLSHSAHFFVDGEQRNLYHGGLHSNFSSFSDFAKMESYEQFYFVENELRLTHSLEPAQPIRPNEFACSICHKTFSSKMGVSQHKRVHELKNRFTCEICAAGFRFKGNLTRHIQARHMHLNRDFQCDICQKSFRFKLELKQHSFVHKAKNRYECNFCYEKFRWKTSLNQHILVYHQKL